MRIGRKQMLAPAGGLAMATIGASAAFAAVQAQAPQAVIMVSIAYPR